MINITVPDVLGWVGMVVLLVTFYLGSSGRLNDRHYLFHILNLTGAMMVFVNALVSGVSAVATVEIVWSCIALVGIWKVFQHNRGRHHALE